MKKLITIVIILFLEIFTTANAQQNSIFGWSQMITPPFPTTDSATLTASTDVYTSFPIIPGYNNQNSLQIDISHNGDGYLFINYIFPNPIKIPLNFDFIFKSEHMSIAVSPIFKYNGEWYFSTWYYYSDLNNGWRIINLRNWESINGGHHPFPADSAVIDTCILYISYERNTTLILDTWYHYGGDSPKLICGFGDVISGLENIYSQTPNNYSLLQNYPNPFNPSTKIKFTIPTTSYVNLDIYNVLGQKVATLVNEELTTGTYEYEFNATNLPSGNYFYTLTSGDYKVTKKMVFLK